MKFRIYRTSDWVRNDAPCVDATLDSTTPHGEKNWAIEITDLDALLKLCGAEGEVIVKSPCPYTDNLPCIEIYDDYRE